MIRTTPIPAFQDNYIWMLEKPDSPDVWVIDPGDAAPVLQTLADRNLQLAGILVTHHHWDHTGGIAGLLAQGEVPVYGPDNPAIHDISHPWRDGDHFELMGERVEVLATPGHTLDHICFYMPSHEPPLLFCGDTLFAAGCGRLFEGTPAQMQASLTRLGTLPPETVIHCTHEYTLANLAFARAVEPDNAALQRRSELCEAQRARGEPTLPCTLREELDTNPFLRTDQPAVRAASQARGVSAGASAVDVFAEVRAWKDTF